MRSHLIVLCVAWAGFGPLLAQTAPTKPQAAVVEFAQKAALRALNFNQGDADALKRARKDFTAEGWAEFTKHMEGFLDASGAPQFNQSFVASGDAVVKGEENGVVHLTIPGTLKQSQNHSNTTYRAEIDIQAGGKPIKIRHLEPVVKNQR